MSFNKQGVCYEPSPIKKHSGNQSDSVEAGCSWLQQIRTTPGLEMNCLCENQPHKTQS